MVSECACSVPSASSLEVTLEASLLANGGLAGVVSNGLVPGHAFQASRVTVHSHIKMSPYALFTDCHRSVTICVCVLGEVCMMRIRTAADLGAFIRERRTKLGMDQIALTKKAGTSRKWLVEVEQGKPRAEIGLILRTLKSLGVSVDLKADSSHETPSISNADINSVLDALKKRP
jgi:HTH-type transcriptional regulator / antitoxin HipB